MKLRSLAINAPGSYVLVVLIVLWVYYRSSSIAARTSDENTVASQSGTNATEYPDSTDIHQRNIPEKIPYNNENIPAPGGKEHRPLLDLTDALNVHVYDISKSNAIETALCVKTRTPSVFNICTWEQEIDKHISGNIQSVGQYEPEITGKIYEVLNKRKNITFIDIGAYIGYFSLFAASIGQPVVSVEPLQWNIETFVRSIHINKFEDRITLIKNAVSNNRRVVVIKAPKPNNFGAARLISENETWSTTNTFYAITIILNDLVQFISTNDVAINIRIEGHECRALERAEEIFDKFNVVFVAMEWNVMLRLKARQGIACPSKNIQQLVDMFTSRGFVSYSFDNKQLDPNEHELWKANNVYWIQKH